MHSVCRSFALLLALVHSGTAIVHLRANKDEVAQHARTPPSEPVAHAATLKAPGGRIPAVFLQHAPWLGGSGSMLTSFLYLLGEKGASTLPGVQESPQVNSIIGETPDEIAAKYLYKSLLAMISVMIWAGLIVLVAKHYLGSVKVKLAPTPAEGVEETMSTYQHGWYECFSDPGTWCWVLCCPAIRWADIMTTMGLFRSFWLAAILFLAINFVAVESNDMCAWILLALICAFFRHELRRKFEMSAGASEFGKDCLLFCFCTTCAITQDARQVSDACKLGHPAAVKQAEEDA